MNIHVSILVGAVAVAIALLITFHWEIIVTDSVTYRLNRWTGTIEICTARDDREPGAAFGSGIEYRCKLIKPEEAEDRKKLQVK